jgi:glycosyltransferase involved in cell wall biosynthesis
MKILVVGAFPRVTHPYSAVFNQRCVAALQEHGQVVEVLAPRPYLPRVAAYLPLEQRWKTWAAIKPNEVRDGISVSRPAYFQIPGIGAAFWVDQGAFFCCRGIARRLHRRVGFDAIVSFDLIDAGGLSWRLGKDLGIPASGWAFGSDLRHPAVSHLGRVALRALSNLDLVFYQSAELFQIGARLLDIDPARMDTNKHVILPHGVPEPRADGRNAARLRVRSSLNIREHEIVILSVASILRDKGVFELLHAMSLAVDRDCRLRCLLVGSLPGFDETGVVLKALESSPGLKEHVTLLPACNPDKVWEYLCGADLFAFPSHNEGMPNSLLEALAMGLPAVAFAIPPVLQIERGSGGLVTVPPFSCTELSEAILRLAASGDERARIGARGRTQVMEHFMINKNMAEAVRRIAQMVADCGTNGAQKLNSHSETCVPAY